MEVTRRRGRRRRKLLDNLKDRRGYSHLKEEALDRSMWRNRFGGGFGPVVRQNTEWINEVKWNKVSPSYLYLKKEHVSPVQLNNKQLTQPEEVKYLGIQLDWKLTWRKHLSTKRKQLDLKLCKLYWIIGRKSRLSLENKLPVYKAILKPIWTDGVQLWGSASNSNI